jgi:biopolymer transport protein ExbD
MRIRRWTKRKARIEIIPMIDTMFFLLVFFMLATLSMTMQRGIPVNLPFAATAREDLRQVVTLTLTQEGKLLYDKEAMASPGVVTERLRQQRTKGLDMSVVINADKSVEHGYVVHLMDAVRQAGVIRMAIAAKPGDDSKRTGLR